VRVLPRALLLAATAALAACGSSPTALRGDFLVAVGEETFVLRASDPETVRLLHDNFRGRNRMFPVGPLRPGDGGFNAPWSWHFDPERVRMAEVAIEVCDGRPSYVEAHLDDFLRGYCPWSARVVGLR
jgi:hypothetical protein